jgi:hypothetical protein
MAKIIGTSYLLVLFTVCALNLDCFFLLCYSKTESKIFSVFDLGNFLVV